MSGTAKPPPAAFTVAVAGIFRARAAKLGTDARHLAIEIDMNGFRERQVARALKGQVSITMDQFYALCDALGLDPREVVREAAPE